MKKIIPLLSLLLVIFFPCFGSLAAKMQDLYIAEVPVMSQLPEVRTRATKKALQQVLLRVSGNNNIETNNYIKEALRRAEYFVQEYSYSTTPSAASYLLKISFNPEDIHRLLKKAGIPYWKENRPLVLVWLTLTNKKQLLEIIDNDAPLELLLFIKKQANKYGIPVIFPLMDVGEIEDIAPHEIATINLPAIKKASNRYRTDALLVGNVIKQQDGQYRGHWLLSLGKDEWTWTISGVSANSVIASAFNQMSQALATHYLIKVENPATRWLKLEVTAVQAKNDLTRLLRYLNKLTVVEQADLAEVKGSVVQISLLINGSLETFQKNAQIGHRLIFKSEDEVNNKLIYEWAR